VAQAHLPGQVDCYCWRPRHGQVLRQPGHSRQSILGRSLAGRLRLCTPG
jgi:hypothetical protein